MGRQGGVREGVAGVRTRAEEEEQTRTRVERGRVGKGRQKRVRNKRREGGKGAEDVRVREGKANEKEGKEAKRG